MSGPAQKTRGFTLIELMIVVAIIAAIAAIAIPSLMQSRVAANEVKIMTALKNYANGQTQYLRRNNVYANDYTLLYTAYPKAPLMDGAVAAANSPTATPYNGYFFGELDKSVNFAIDFNLGAAPIKYDSSGVFVFFITAQGIVFEKDLGNNSIPSAVPDPEAEGWLPSGQ